MVDYENIKMKDESAEIVLKVLPEYSDKLLNLFECYQKERRNYFLMYVLFIIFFALAAIFGNVVLKQFTSPSATVNPIYFTAFLFSLAFSLATIFRVTLVMSLKQKTLRRNIIFLSSQLKKVIKLASQLEDKSEPNIARRLELSLRLFEAEGVYDMVEPALPSNIIDSKLSRFLDSLFPFHSRRKQVGRRIS